MEKRAVRCSLEYAELNSVYNHEVYYCSPGLQLAICLNCGERFVIDIENPRTAGLSIAEIAGDQHCPNCDSILGETLKEYPKHFRTNDGKVGQLETSHHLPQLGENLIIEFWEIRP